MREAAQKNYTNVGSVIKITVHLKLNNAVTLFFTIDVYSNHDIVATAEQ